MISLITTVVTFVLVLGVIVFVHEFGHFIVAKLVGVRVEKFSLGFGPVLFKKRVGETQYQIAALPLGGFVKMSGEEPDEEDPESAPEDDDLNLPPCPPERMFNRQAIPKRMAIVVAGPVMNVILAMVLVPIVYMIGIEVDSSLYQKPVIGFVEADGPAGKGGIVPGDEIIRIDGKPMATWKKVKTHVLFHPDKDLNLEIRHGSEIKVIRVHTSTMASLGGGTIGVYPDWPSRIHRVMPGKPAERAGLKADDLIVAVDDLQNPHWFETQSAIQKHVGRSMSFTVLRAGQPVTLTLTPEPRPDSPELGMVGIEPVTPSEMRRFGFFEAISLGVQENIENTLTTFVVVGKLFTGGLNIKAVGGPVQIAEFTGAAAHEGFTHLLLFMAFISLQLAILNLLPVPVLDGGHVVFMLVEAIKGSPISSKKRLIAQQVAMVLLITMMVVVTFNDVARHADSIRGLFKHKP